MKNTLKLFELVPGNFFSILASSNREIYFDSLIILHNKFKYDLNISVEDYLASLISILEDRAYEPEEDDDASTGLQEGGWNTLSGKARLILNRLIKTGWLDKELLEGSFTEIITPRRYAIPILKVLSELGDGELQEYNSLVFSTYSALKQAISENEPHVYEALLSARANTEQLQYSLRALYHGIRGFLRDIIERHDVNLLLEEHFGEYKRMADNIYHPIKTMDSVHRYMSPIQNLLADIMANDELMQSMRERAISVKKYEDGNQANNEIMKAIDYVLDFYQRVGSLIGEIDRKHSNYTKSSIEKIRYLMTADQTMKGKLAEILKAYVGMPEKREQLAEIMERRIQVGRQEFIDAESLYHKNVKRRRINREPLAVAPREEFAGAANALLLRQIKEGFPAARIRAFIDSLFADGINEIEAKNIPIRSDVDFILLILAVVRRKERGMTFTVDMYDGRVENNGYVIPNMVIRKMEARSRVE